MIEVMQLPPQDIPKQLTARVVLKTLGDHAQAFLNSTNKRGFLDDPDSVVDDSTVIGTLLLFATMETVTSEQIYERAEHLVDISNGVMVKEVAVTTLMSALGQPTPATNSLLRRGPGRKKPYHNRSLEKSQKIVRKQTSGLDSSKLELWNEIQSMVKQYGLPDVEDNFFDIFNTVEQILDWFRQQPIVTRHILKLGVRRIQVISEEKPKLMQTFTLIAKALGHVHYNAMLERSVDHICINLHYA